MFVVAGSIRGAIEAVRRVSGFTLLIDVEVQSESEADEAIDAGADIVMLDNLEGSSDHPSQNAVLMPISLQVNTCTRRREI